VTYWAAEVLSLKRDVILQRASNVAVPLQHLFSNVLEMQTGVESFDYVSKKMVVPPKPDIVVAGFPCIDLSLLNGKPPPFDAIQTYGCGQSSQVLGGILCLVRAWLPVVLVLENVLGLLRKVRKRESAEHQAPHAIPVEQLCLC